MTQAPYLAEITAAGCAVPPEGLDAALTVWPEGVPRCGLAETLGISEAELLAFMFGRDAPACTISCGSPPVPPPVPVPLPEPWAVLAAALLALAGLRAVRGPGSDSGHPAAREQTPPMVAAQGAGRRGRGSFPASRLSRVPRAARLLPSSRLPAGRGRGRGRPVPAAAIACARAFPGLGSPRRGEGGAGCPRTITGAGADASARTGPRPGEGGAGRPGEPASLPRGAPPPRGSFGGTA